MFKKTKTLSKGCLSCQKYPKKPKKSNILPAKNPTFSRILGGIKAGKKALFWLPWVYDRHPLSFEF